MPTKEWLEQHTKIQAYLDADLSFKLTAWMKEKNITQLSQAVVAILEHYLNNHPPSEISSQVLFDEVETLKKEVAIIKASLEAYYMFMKQVFYDVLFLMENNY